MMEREKYQKSIRLIKTALNSAEISMFNENKIYYLEMVSSWTNDLLEVLKYGEHLEKEKK